MCPELVQSQPCEDLGVPKALSMTSCPQLGMGDQGELQSHPEEKGNEMGCPMVRADEWGPTLENLSTKIP